MIAALLAASLHAATLDGLTSCRPIAGVEALWKDEVRYIFVGETHGTTEAPAAFENGPFVHHDGRGSLAMLDLLLRLRGMARDGKDLTVLASVPESPRVEGFSQSYAEMDRAVLWGRHAMARPQARVLVLVGRVHAEKIRRVGSPLGLPAAAHIRPEETLSLTLARQGGEAWICLDECGVAPIPVTDDLMARGIVLTPQQNGKFDGLLALGPVTASLPVPR